MNYVGKYRAIVVDNKDPSEIGRVKIRCSEVYGSSITYWALPCFKPNEIRIPQIGDTVWVEFEHGIKTKPVWVGVVYTKEQLKALMGVYDPSKVVLKSVGDTALLSEKAFKVESKVNAEINTTAESAQTSIGSLSTLSISATGTVSATNDLITEESVKYGGSLIDTDPAKS